jgi:hypothetical protein
MPVLKLVPLAAPAAEQAPQIEALADLDRQGDLPIGVSRKHADKAAGDTGSRYLNRPIL